MPGTFTDPFEATSLWDSPINTATATQYSSPTAIYNEDFRNTALDNTWIQKDDLFNFTKPESPAARRDVVTLNDGGVVSSGAIDIRTPSDIQFVGETDHLSIFSDLVDFANGTGFGQDGVGAGGTSLLGSVVTWDELKSGTINHALTIELSPAQLNTGADQFVFPAVSAVSGSTELYTGSVPMGAHFALPANVDIAAAGLTPEGATIAHAYQTYGGYMVDSAAATTSLAEVVGMPAAQVVAEPRHVLGTFIHPFEATSLWNSPINTATATQYSSPTAIYNENFRNTALGNTWIEADDLFHFTKPESPAARWDVVTFNDGGVFSSGAMDIRTPSDIQFVHGTDQWSIFTDLDGSHYYEVWGGSYDAATGTYGAEYMVRGDFVNGTGFGQDGVGAGIRAAGASLLGGVVTWDELKSGTIDHALAIELSPAQLKAGTGADQFVFPAVSADSGSTELYTGSIPMGAHFALPANVDIAAAGLTPEGATIAHAYQTYGGYVVDMAGATTSLAEVVGMPAAQADDFYNNVVYNDMPWLRDHLIMI